MASASKKQRKEEVQLEVKDKFIEWNFSWQFFHLLVFWERKSLDYDDILLDP